MSKKLLSFTLRLVFLGAILTMVYALFPQRMDLMLAVRLGFLSAVLITAVSLSVDFVTLVFKCIFIGQKIRKNC